MLGESNIFSVCSDTNIVSVKSNVNILYVCRATPTFCVQGDTNIHCGCRVTRTFLELAGGKFSFKIAFNYVTNLLQIFGQDYIPYFFV